MDKRARFGNSAGYQLLDLLLFLSLLVFLAGLSIPRSREFLDSAVLREESARLRQTLERTALRAMQSRARVTVLLQPSGYFARGDESFINWYQLPPRVELVIQGGSKQEIVFYPSGVASPQTALLKYGATECRITVSLRGRISSSC